MLAARGTTSGRCRSATVASSPTTSRPRRRRHRGRRVQRRAARDGHRTDLRAVGAIAREVGAIVFVDGSQLVGALPVAPDLDAIDVLATSDHKFLLNAGRGMGYCYLSPARAGALRAGHAGMEGGPGAVRELLRADHGPLTDRVPLRQLDQLARGDRRRRGARGLRRLRRRVASTRNAELTDRLRQALTDVGWTPVALPEANRSTIVSVPLGDAAAGTAPRGAPGRGPSWRRTRRESAVVGPLLQRRRRHRAGRPRARRALTGTSVACVRGATSRRSCTHAIPPTRARSACGPERVVEPVEDHPVGQRPVEDLAVVAGAVGVRELDELLAARQRVVEVLGVARRHVATRRR